MSAAAEWLRLSEVLRVLEARGYSSDNAATAIAAAIAWGGPITRLRFPERPSLWSRSNSSWTDENGALTLDLDKSTILVPLAVGKRRVPVWSTEIVEISREDVDRVWPASSSTLRYASDAPLIERALHAIRNGTVTSALSAARLVQSEAYGATEEQRTERLRKLIRARMSAAGEP